MVDIRKIAYMLGASIPVVAVGGIIALSKVTDPPNETTPIRSQKSYRDAERVSLARDLCSDGADTLIIYAHKIEDIAEGIVTGMVSLKEIPTDLERTAEFIEFDLRKLAEKADKIGDRFPDVRDAVKSAFPQKLGEDVAKTLRDLAVSIKETQNELAVYNSLLAVSDNLTKRGLDGYCECLRKALILIGLNQ
jgi:hypothetical protein